MAKAAAARQEASSMGFLRLQEADFFLTVPRFTQEGFVLGSGQLQGGLTSTIRKAVPWEQHGIGEVFGGRVSLPLMECPEKSKPTEHPRLK